MYDFAKLRDGDRIVVRSLASGIDFPAGHVLDATVSSAFEHTTYFTGDDGHFYQSTDCYHLGGGNRGKRLGKDWELIHAPAHALAAGETVQWVDLFNKYAEFESAGHWFYRGFFVVKEHEGKRGWHVPGIDPYAMGESDKPFRTMRDAMQWVEREYGDVKQWSS